MDLTALVVLARNVTVWQWVVRFCPICGKEHIHGGGKLTDDPRKFLGSRSAHCNEDKSDYSYTMVEDTRLPDAKWFKKRRYKPEHPIETALTTLSW